MSSRVAVRWIGFSKTMANESPEAQINRRRSRQLLTTRSTFSRTFPRDSVFIPRKRSSSATLRRGKRSRWRYRWSCLRPVGDQLAQERNQHNEHDTDREAAKTKRREELRVPGVGGDRRGACRLGNHSREVACKQGREAGHEHPAAHHDALILFRRELSDHRISDRHEKQLTDALQH